MESFSIFESGTGKSTEIVKECPNCRESVTKENREFSFDKNPVINGVKLHKYKCKCGHDLTLGGISVKNKSSLEGH